MFFMFRALFWLGLILTIIWWSGGTGNRKPGAAEGKLQSLSTLAGRSLEDAKTRLEQACLQRPRLCIDLLSQYTRNEAEKDQQGMLGPVSSNKAKAESKRPGHSPQTAPQRRDPVN